MKMQDIINRYYKIKDHLQWLFVFDVFLMFFDVLSESVSLRFFQFCCLEYFD